MTCILHAQKITPYGFVYLAKTTIESMAPVVEAMVSRRPGSTQEEILLISIATGWEDLKTGKPHVEEYHVDLTSEKELKRLYSRLKKRGNRNSFRLIRRILDWSDKVFDEHDAKISASPDPASAENALAILRNEDKATMAYMDRFLATASDAALLVSVRTESERKTALARIEDLMDAKPGTPAGDELSRLGDWVLEYDAQQERREEIETLKREIAELRDSMSEVLKLVNGVMDLTARAGGSA